MNRLERKIESGARKYTLGRALSLVVIWTAYGTVGAVQVVKFFSARDLFYLYAGIFNMLIGFFMVWFFLRMTHAVVRRMVAEAATPPAAL